jgi:hypothetical protein
MESKVKDALFEYQFNDFFLNYPRYFDVEDYYIGKPNPLLYSEFDILSKETNLIGFTLPKDIYEVDFEIYIDGDLVDEDIVYKYKNHRIYIDYPGVDETFTGTISVLWFPNQNIINEYPKEHWDDYVELEFNNSGYYLKGEFLEVEGIEYIDSLSEITSIEMNSDGDVYMTVTHNDIENEVLLDPDNDLYIGSNGIDVTYCYHPEHILSTTAIGVKDDRFYLTHLERINSNVVKLSEEHALADKLFIMVNTEKKTYYSDLLKDILDGVVNFDNIPNREYFTEIDELADTYDYDELDIVKEKDFGMFRYLEEKIYGKLKTTHDIEDLDIIYTDDRNHRFLKNTKLNFYKPKIHLKVKNKKNLFPEVFINRRLYTDERITFEKGNFTHIFIGIEKIFKDNIDIDSMKLFNGLAVTDNEVKEYVSELLSDEEILIDVNLKPEDYFYSNFSLPNDKNGYLFLPKNYNDIHDKRFYMNGRLMEEDEYLIESHPIDNYYILYFTNEIPVNSTFSITGFTENSYYDKIKVPHTFDIEGNSAYYKNDIYYKGDYIEHHTFQLSSFLKRNQLVETEDRGELTIFIRKDLPDIYYDYRENIIELNPIDFDIPYDSNIVNDSIFDDISDYDMDLFKYYVELVEPGYVGTSDGVDSELFGIIEERYPNIIGTDGTIIINHEYNGFPMDILYPDTDVYETRGKVKYLLGEYTDDEVPDYILEEIDKRGHIHIDHDVLQFVKHNYLDVEGELL